MHVLIRKQYNNICERFYYTKKSIFWVRVLTQTKSSLFGSVFTILIIDFRWWKSPPGHAAGDFPTIIERYPTRRAVQTFTAIFSVRVPTQNQL